MTAESTSPEKMRCPVEVTSLKCRRLMEGIRRRMCARSSGSAARLPCPQRYLLFFPYGISGCRIYLHYFPLTRAVFLLTRSLPFHLFIEKCLGPTFRHFSMVVNCDVGGDNDQRHTDFPRHILFQYQGSVIFRHQEIADWNCWFLC
jgi:hypothetical protein